MVSLEIAPKVGYSPALFVYCCTRIRRWNDTKEESVPSKLTLSKSLISTYFRSDTTQILNRKNIYTVHPDKNRKHVDPGSTPIILCPFAIPVYDFCLFDSLQFLRNRYSNIHITRSFSSYVPVVILSFLSFFFSFWFWTWVAKCSFSATHRCQMWNVAQSIIN